MSRTTHTVRLISWKTDRAAELIPVLEDAGYKIDAEAFDGTTLKALAKSPPAAVVIDLARIPSKGRDVGVAIRTRASTRDLPLVFVDGSDAAVAAARKILPDAVYTSLESLPEDLALAIAEPPTDPVVPASNLAGYSGTPLPKKLGIKEGATVSLIDPPDDIETVLGSLPNGTTLATSAPPDPDVTLWFVRSFSEFENRLEELAATIDRDRLWVCWPKKSSGISTDITQNEIRSMGLATGLVDFKICAVDATWSGLCFTRRKK
jgi:hypothetical protein